MIRPTFVCLAVAIACVSSGTRVASGGEDRFAQLGTLLPSPSESRLASGAPGPGYWQQRVDYDIDVTLDAATDEIRGRETVTYHNDAPHELAYLWLQLDPNRFAPDAPARTTDTGGLDDEIAIRRLTSMTAADRFDGSMRIGSVTSEEKPLRHAVIGGLLRVVPPGPIAPGDVFTFDVTWAYTVNDIKVRPGRTGYERLDDGEKIFAIAQWYPRLCAYTDYGGWRVKQFLGRGEFTLEFGDFDVRITAPADHLLYATGELRNAAEVLTEPQRRRLADLGPTPKPVVTAEEAAATRGAEPTSATKTWRFAAKNVRDFAFASSRTFAWDACEAEIAGETVVCQALYPVEGRPLWDRYAARVTRHAIEVYSDVTGIPYPYPHATTFLGVVRGGMEYPMISFNGPRPEEDGTYSKGVRDFVVSVIIHEVGHNWFPMIVNSDERHWMWLDEGVNTFVEQIARRRWSTIEGTTRADPHSLRGYQKDKNKRQVMTQGDAVFSLGANAYAKPAVALNILRETVLGRENFDFAFREYCRRWAFKRPEPADLFRTLEDASGVDLDWFWRGWFYSSDYCDWSVDAVVARPLRRGDPAETSTRAREKDAADDVSLTAVREADSPTVLEAEADLTDFYDTYDPHAVTPEDIKNYSKFLERLTPEERKALGDAPQLYEITVRNDGRLVMPLILELEFTDGTTETRRFPAEIWRKADDIVTRVVMTSRPLAAVTVDPLNETGDVSLENNRFPPRIDSRDLKIKKAAERKIDNPLKRAREADGKTKGSDKDEDGQADKAE